MSFNDFDFLLYDWLELNFEHGLDQHLNADLIAQMLRLVQQLADAALAPAAAELDQHPPRVENGKVITPGILQHNLQALAKTGMFELSAPLSEGGLQLPLLLQSVIGLILMRADATPMAYVELTRGAANLIRNFGSSAQRETYLPPMVTGRWFGTMCLSEAHAGSSVGDLRSKAVLRDDGRYAIRGSKMWISGCEHELSENIVHLVLARIEGAPVGTKGLSLFVVPRYRIEQGTKLDNFVRLSGLNHKMGYKGTVNGALNFGDGGECIGELLGAPGSGMAQMFQMMNEARIAVGIGGAAMAQAGAGLAERYAFTRLQGRPLDRSDPNQGMIAIVHHPDVKAMLLRARSFADGAMLLCLWCAKLADQAHRNGSGELHKLIGLLTPMVKSWPAKYGLEANDIAIQVLGGAGYTRDFAAEKYYRDNRLNAIHEGTHGIQGLDLVARKILADQGQSVVVLLQEIATSVKHAMQFSELREFAPMSLELATALAQSLLKQASANPSVSLAHASQVLDCLGSICVSFLTLSLASKTLSHSTRDANALLRRARWVANAQWLHRYHLPEVAAKIDMLKEANDMYLQTPDALGFASET